MSRLLEVVSRLFVEPAAAEAPEDVRWVPPAARDVAAVAVNRVVVLCAPRDCRVAGGAAGLAVAQRSSAPSVQVLEWTGHDHAPPPARHGSRRLTRTPLPGDESAAADTARRALLQPVPAVVVIAAPRGEPMDALVGEADRVLVALRPATDDLLADIAHAQLTDMAPSVRRVVLQASSPAATALARAGTALVAPLRGPFLEALG